MADVSIWTDTQALGTYVTGGFSVVTNLSAIANFTVKIKTRGALPAGHFEWSASGGTATVRFIQHSHDKVTAISSNLSGLPSGVTQASTSGQSYTAEASHTHPIDHDHAAVTTGAITPGTGNLAGATATWSAHTHSADPPSFTGPSGAGGSHTHTWNNLYQHSHTVTSTSTNGNQAELANGTDLSTVTVIYHAVSG